MSIGVITNEYSTKEDEKILVNSGVLPESRIIGVETWWMSSYCDS